MLGAGLAGAGWLTAAWALLGLAVLVANGPGLGPTTAGTGFPTGAAEGVATTGTAGRAGTGRTGTDRAGAVRAGAEAATGLGRLGAELVLGVVVVGLDWVAGARGAGTTTGRWSPTTAEISLLDRRG